MSATVQVASGPCMLCRRPEEREFLLDGRDRFCSTCVVEAVLARGRRLEHRAIPERSGQASVCGHCNKSAEPMLSMEFWFAPAGHTIRAHVCPTCIRSAISTRIVAQRHLQRVRERAAAARPIEERQADGGAWRRRLVERRFALLSRSP
jgi:hypothetical protein